MKYINKKLPLVGEELRYSPMEVDGVHCFDNGTLHCNKSTLKTLLSEGWIEEVKPREWWVNMHKDSGNNYFCNTKDEAIRTMWGLPEHNHIIKVREVIQ